ncbi:uncharacterized protein ACBR49_013041 [Aulostomus maculatus]
MRKQEGNADVSRDPRPAHAFDGTECEMATSALPAVDGWRSSQLKIVLLGGRNSGKSCLGNLILGKEEFVTKERTSCSRRLGLVGGRWLTVVDTPGWWCDASARDTPALVKGEILSSVPLCSPGPDVFLITVKASSAFSERRRRVAEEHVALLGEAAWSRCILVFTSAARSERREAEELAEAGGEALGWLLGKCSQRYHSVNLSDDSDVTPLLATIQRLVTQNGNRVFEMEENRVQAIAEEKRGAEERAQRRFTRMKEHRSAARGKLRPVTNIRMVLVGSRGSGKTSVLNTILGRENRQQPPGRTSRCQAAEGVVFGRQLTVVDTPGWWRNYFSEETPVFDRREIRLSLSLCPPGPHVVLLVIRVDRAFTETNSRAVEEHVQLIGDRIWSRVIVVFSFGDWLADTTTELYVEAEGEPLHRIVDRCCNRYHVLNNKTKGDGFQVRELIGKIEEMVAGLDGAWHCGMEQNQQEDLEGMKRREEGRAEERLLKKTRQRLVARSQLEKLGSLPELRLVLIGGSKTGKSSCGNSILSREGFHSRAASCAQEQTRINNKYVTVVDTPSCFHVTSELLTPPSSTALLLVVNISSSFNISNLEALERQLETAGGLAWTRSLVLFSYGDWLGDTGVEQRIESEGGALQRLVNRCGNRYHVLDNKHRGDGTQVSQLMELIEEMLVGERLQGVEDTSSSSEPERRVDTVTLRTKDSRTLSSCRHQRPCDLSVAPSARPPLTSSEVTRDDAQVVALPAGRGRPALHRGRLMSCLVSLLSGTEGLRCTATRPPRLAVNLPVWHRIHDPLSLSPAGWFSYRHPTTVLPQAPHASDVHSLSRPTQTAQTLGRPTGSGGLQAAMEQWGDNSLEELEAFIDVYFETALEQAAWSFEPAEPNCPSAEQHVLAREAGEEVLLSIDRKLSKLDLLEEMRADLEELRRTLESSLKATQELRDKGKQDANSTR